MSATCSSKQELQFLKEENLRMIEKFRNFLKKQKSTQKLKDFVNEQDILINNINEKFDEIIAKDNQDEKEHSRMEHTDKVVNETMFVDNDSVLENFMKSPGLRHLAEKIFVALDYQVLESCGKINKTFQKILDDPMFWLKRFVRKGLSKKNQIDWTEAIQMTRDGRADPDLEKNILLYLKGYSRNERVVDFDVPCYLNDQGFLKKAPELIKSFTCDCTKKIKKFLIVPYIRDLYDHVRQAYCFCSDHASHFHKKLENYYKRHEHEGFYRGKEYYTRFESDEEPFQEDVPSYIKENWHQGPLYSNSGWTVFHDAVKYGNLALIQLLAPLAESPNELNDEGRSPIYLAAQKENSDIIKLLAPFD